MCYFLLMYLVLLHPLRWCCVDCMIHYERDVREEQKYMYVARTSNNRVISSGDLYCWLLPRCEALRTCRSGFPIATVFCWCLTEMAMDLGCRNRLRKDFSFFGSRIRHQNFRKKRLRTRSLFLAD